MTAEGIRKYITEKCWIDENGGGHFDWSKASLKEIDFALKLGEQTQKDLEARILGLTNLRAELLMYKSRITVKAKE